MMSMNRHTVYRIQHSKWLIAHPKIHQLYIRWNSLLRRASTRIESVVSYVWNLTGLQRRYYVKRASAIFRFDTAIATTRLIRSCTNIPVPLAYFQLRFLWKRWLIMDRIPGIALDSVLSKLSIENRQRITDQLRRYMEELRSIPRPEHENPSTIASVGGGPIYCIRLHGDQDLSGPFRDEQHMNRQLRNDRPLEDFADPVATLHSTSHRIVLTHNDFAPRNVMVLQNESGQWDVSAIIDWDSAGWLPEYWEYAKTVNVSAWEPDSATRIWHEILPSILDVYAVEAEADRILDNAIPNRPYKHIP